MEMRAVLAVLCVALASAADGNSAAAEEQWAPFFGEASRASEGLPWSSVAPQSEDRGDATEERKDEHKVTITKKVKVPYTVHVEKRIPKIIEVPVDKPFNVYVPKPYPVIVEKKVPYEIKVHQPQPYTVEKRVPYPVKVLVDKPYTLHVPKPYPVDVEKKYEFTVEKKIPYEVKVPVERPYPVHVIVEKEVKFPVEKKVPVPVKVPHEKPIPIHVTKHVPVHVDKPVPYTVEKVTTYPVKVPFRIPIKVHYTEGGEEGQVQNFEWAEAMDSAVRAAKLESRPAQWHGAQYWQAESKPSQEQTESHRLQWHQQQPVQGQAESQRPQWHQQHPALGQGVSLRPARIRQGFSYSRGSHTRNSYFLGNQIGRPTTKLRPVGHHYEVKEPQSEQLPTTPYLTRPGSEVIVPQTVLTDSPANSVLLPQSNSQHTLQQPNPPNSGSQHSNPTGSGWQLLNSPNSGLKQSSSPTSGYQQSNSPTSRYQQSSPQTRGLHQSKYLHSLQHPSNPTANSISSFQQNPSLSFSNGIPQLDHQNITGTQSFSITNVIHHAGAPSQQTVVHHGVPQVAPEGRPTAQSPSSTFFKPAQNNSAFGLRTTQTPQSATPFGTSGFTISFQSPAQSQALQQPLFKQSTNTNDVSSSYVGTRTVHEGQQLTYSSSIHHEHNTPKPEQKISS